MNSFLLRTLLVCQLAGSLAFGQSQTDEGEASKTDQSETEELRPVAEVEQKPLPAFSAKLLKTLDKATALNEKETTFLNRKSRRLFLKTRVACNDCLLEMLVCPVGTKEHEAVLTFDGKASVVHAGLLALGMEPGKPVVLSPEFQAPDGPVVDMKVHWVDQKGKLQSADPRKWMRTSVSHFYSAPMKTKPKGIEFPFLELRYDPYNKELLWFGHMTESNQKELLAKSDDEEFQKIIKDFYRKSQYKPMEASFVFTGSFMAQRYKDGPKFYAAEDGYLICVANFAAATIDVKEASSASDGSRSYESNVDVMPPRDTPVILEMSAAKSPEKASRK